MNAKELFMNGEFIPAEKGVISVRTHGFAYGTGCFEGIRGYWNEQDQQVYLFRLREHYERLLRSCKILHISLPYTIDELIDISVELVRRNGQREDVYLRPVAYKGDTVIGVRLHGLEDHFVLTAEPMGNYIEMTGLRCGVSSWRRIDDNAIPARAKIIGGYVNAAFAKTEATQNGYDEAIMLTSEGHVSEGSAENIFMIVTVDRTELYTADEILLCGTGAQIAPVISVDQRDVGNGMVGPIARQLQELYFDVVRGKRPEYKDWCTPVFAEVPQHS